MSNWKYLSEQQKELIQNLDNLIKEATELRKGSLDFWEMQRKAELLELNQIALPSLKQYMKVINAKNCLRLMKDVCLTNYRHIKYSQMRINEYFYTPGEDGLTGNSYGYEDTDD